MSRKNILVTLPLLKRQQQELEEAVKGSDREFSFYYSPLDRHLPEDMIRQGMVRKTENIPALIHGIVGDCKPDRVRQYYDSLEFFQSASAGYDGHVKPGILNQNCVFCNTSGAYHDIVSEQLLGLTFACCRRMDLTLENQKAGLWKHPGPLKAINQSVAVILGVGDIGLSYAKKMKALGAYTIGIRKRNLKKPQELDEQYTMDHLMEVLPRADILALILPGGPETDQLIGEQELPVMKADAVIVNAGRGSVLDEKALMSQMEKGRFFSVGLDVASQEPLPPDHPLWKAPRIIITPHTGGTWQRETQNAIFEISKNNLHVYACGGTYTHVVAHA